MKQLIYDSLLSETGGLTLQDVFINFIAAAILACLIYISYKVSHSGAVYSERFNVSLVMLTMVTTLVMNVIGNNIALSLGMVGALSIVRFRTAIKDPRDTAYIFWAIAVGICCGVSDYLIAAIGSVFIFIFLILFGFIKDNERVLIIIHSDDKHGEEIINHMKSLFAGKAICRVQNCSVQAQTAEYIYEVSDKLLKKSETKNGPLIKNLTSQEGIFSVNVVKQDDEINQ
jgi:uncharacterized membrane protein YhiD involved in acid resistance